MSYARKNLKNVVGAIAGVLIVAALAVWQFYKFATFTATSAVSGANGNSHLWWAIAMTVLACVAAFLVFSIFMRHDTDDDLHITSIPRITRI